MSNWPKILNNAFFAGDRTGLIWTLIVPEDGKGFESIGIVSDLMRESGNT